VVALIGNGLISLRFDVSKRTGKVSVVAAEYNLPKTQESEFSGELGGDAKLLYLIRGDFSERTSGDLEGYGNR